MNKIDYQKEAEKMFDFLRPRINEALRKDNWNPAYELVFSIGLIYDIKEELKRIMKKVRR